MFAYCIYISTSVQRLARQLEQGELFSILDSIPYRVSRLSGLHSVASSHAQMGRRCLLKVQRVLASATICAPRLKDVLRDSYRNK
ncbi:hypothetical protein KC366_g100 [Hortaea werneckii]|nr:hypothetical protein KC366_g100 [Hortaea werneckii]